MPFDRSILGMAALLVVVVPARGQDAELVRALGQHDRSLRPVKDLVVRADFDQDGDLDFAAVVTDGRQRAFLILESDEGRWRAHPLYARLPDSAVRLRIAAPGPHRVLGAHGSVELTAPGVELTFPGRSSALYAYRAGRWQVFGTEAE